MALFAEASLVQVLPVASANACWWGNSEFAPQLSCPSHFVKTQCGLRPVVRSAGGCMSPAQPTLSTVL